MAHILASMSKPEGDEKTGINSQEPARSGARPLDMNGIPTINRAAKPDSQKNYIDVKKRGGATRNMTAEGRRPCLS
jgi:hypothetical protein